MADRDDVFEPETPPARLSALEKATRTDRTAKGILTAEVAAREEKTAHLRRLRMEQQNQRPLADKTK